MNSRKTSEQLARQLAQVRKKKINKLKEKISSGKYHISNDAVAKSLFMATY